MGGLILSLCNIPLQQLQLELNFVAYVYPLKDPQNTYFDIIENAAPHSNINFQLQFINESGQCPSGDGRDVNRGRSDVRIECANAPRKIGVMAEGSSRANEGKVLAFESNCVIRDLSKTKIEEIGVLGGHFFDES